MSKKNLLLEIGTEEIPAGFIDPALEQMKNFSQQKLNESRLSHGEILISGTPRRLTLFIEDVDERQTDLEEKIIGPPVKVAFSPKGKPTKAAKGFASQNSISVDDLEKEMTDRGEYVVAKVLKKGLPALELLETLLPEVITNVNFPKSMKWGEYQERFARPVKWIVSLFGEDIINISFAGVQSSSESFGHRFMHNSSFKVSSSYLDYKQVLKDAYVIIDPDERLNEIISQASKEAEKMGGKLLEDRDLALINLNLVEYPQAVCGSFDTEFLKLPKEVLITCMKEHQKYFSVIDEKNNLMPNFVAINNTPSKKPEIVKTGHEKVIKARLNDASFFYKEDIKKSLDKRVEDLSGMVFHRNMGTLLDKTRRVQELAVYLSDIVAPEVKNICARAAWLCKADLLTEMVDEFPDLQGIMGREYAMLSGETNDVARTIAEHYMPLKSGSEVPGSLSGAVLSIADRIDTICATFAVGLRPTGTQDPYALKRHALAIISITKEWGFSFSLNKLVNFSLNQLTNLLPELPVGLHEDIINFIKTRFINDLLSGNDIAHDTVNAAVNAEFDDLLDSVMRTMAIEQVRSKPEFEPLSIAFKRVMNILKNYPGGGTISHSLFEADQEKELHRAYVDLKERITPMIDKEQGLLSGKIDYENALIELLTIKPYVDDFFDNVMVMTDDEKVKENRLALLWYISKLFLRIGDLSAITTQEG